MKIKQYVRKSLSRQFIVLISVFIILLLIGIISIYFSQKHFNDIYLKNRSEIIKKEKIARQIQQEYNEVFLNIRGYLAFDNNELKTKALSKEVDIRKQIEQLESLLDTEEDPNPNIVNELNDFTDYYFIYLLPYVTTYFENGQIEEIQKMSNAGATKKLEDFINELDDYINDIHQQLNNEVKILTTKQYYIQYAFIFYIIFIFINFFVFIQLIFKRLGKPLAELAVAANDLAIGKEVKINVDHYREDEIGVLSIAFLKMIQSLQDKEQDLKSQNEELTAQQDELIAQQTELQSTLETLCTNEKKLEQIITLINGISNSLDKQEVLNSIIYNMCEVAKADSGILSMLNENSNAAIGISQKGMRQFRTYMFNGMLDKLVTFKKPFTLIRKLPIEEMGYHEQEGYCYDLYLPIMASTQEVVAIIVLSRYSSTFSQQEMEELGTLARQIGISLDKISLYEQTEEGRKLNQDIISTVQEGIQLVDTKGMILQVNNKLCEMTGKKEPSQLVGLLWKTWTKNLKELIEENDSFIEFIQSSIQEGADVNKSFTFKTNDLNKVIKVYCKDLFRGNDKFGTVIVYRDITKEFEVDQMKSEFVSTVSHELRTPLSSILGFTELMLHRELKPEKQKKYLTTIYSETIRLTALINDFLDVQRMEAGKQTYEKKYIELVPIIQKVIENQKVNTKMHKLVLESNVNSNYILGDKSKIEQVLTNVINNAIKYSPKGGSINIKVYQENKMIKVDVKDHGLGIPEESLDKLFNKFYRVDNSDHRKIGGTGLGLAIVQEILKAHNGIISVNSNHKQGSTFTLSFPIIELNVMKQKIKGNENNRYQIMVVEDDQSLAGLMMQELIESGFSVVHYQKGYEALQAINIQVPDAIILDILLEDDGLDGWDIMEKLKDNNQWKDIPIIISTALDEKEKGLSLGAKNYLIKPYQTSILSKAIMQTLLNMGKVGQVLIPEDNN